MNIKIYDHSERQPGQGIRTPDAPRDPWDAFTEQDPIFVKYWEAMVATFPQYTLYLCDDEDVLLASATAVPFFWGDSLEKLPDEGWRWVVQNAVEQHQRGIKANLVSALGIHVSPAYRGQGLSRLALDTMRNAAKKRGFAHLVAPVRPSQKHLYPLIPMAEYITWTRDDGLSFDAWIRTHQRLGARITMPCSNSMMVSGTVAQWRKWTGIEFPGSGAHIIPGALSPVEIDLEQNQGMYVEANVWMLHPLD